MIKKMKKKGANQIAGSLLVFTLCSEKGTTSPSPSANSEKDQNRLTGSVMCSAQ